MVKKIAGDIWETFFKIKKKLERAAFYGKQVKILNVHGHFNVPEKTEPFRADLPELVKKLVIFGLSW